MKTLRINRSKHLCDEPGTGHNRWHPDVEPLLEVAEGEEVCFETRDALDGYLPPGSTVEDLARFARGVVHPLTGPVAIKGARPGDLLEIEFLDITPEARRRLRDVRADPGRPNSGSALHGDLGRCAFPRSAGGMDPSRG
jgi:formamidase